MGNRHGRDGNCLLHRPLWRAFSYSSFSLKASTGGAEVPAWHAAFDASAALCWKGSMGEDGKTVWTPSEATVGWTNETEGGRGLTATVPGVRLHLPPPLSSSSAVALIPVDQTQPGTFAHRRMFYIFPFSALLWARGRFSHSDGLSLIMWLKLSVSTAVSRATCRSPTCEHCTKQHVYIQHINQRGQFFLF